MKIVLYLSICALLFQLLTAHHVPQPDGENEQEDLQIDLQSSNVEAPPKISSTQGPLKLSSSTQQGLGNQQQQLESESTESLPPSLSGSLQQGLDYHLEPSMNTLQPSEVSVTPALPRPMGTRPITVYDGDKQVIGEIGEFFEDDDEY